MNRDLIQPLTGLRALAAFDVFFSHFPIKGLPPFLQGIFSQGYIGVGVFGGGVSREFIPSIY
ncbi:MAG: hypothetical protein PWK00_07035 [Coxiella burnetii]|nr:hypothetical protein [Coxiella burnetii]